MIVVALLLSAGVQSAHAAEGCAIAIGGALKYDNTEVWQRIVQQAGGKGARFAVFASAAGNPDKSAANIIKALEQQGAIAEHIPVAVTLKTRDWKEAVRDPLLIDKVKASQGVYFAGGAQERITQVLLENNDKPTAMLEAIWSVYRRGGVVAGSSAGAAIMSTTMFRDAQDVLSVLKFGAKDGKEIDRGLGFVGPDIFVDQHFLKRGRFGRMLPVMVQKGYKLGLGIDENTAAFFCGSQVEIVGFKGALVVDLTDAVTNPKAPEFNIKNARLTYLDRGDKYDFASRKTTPSQQKLADAKIDPNSPDFKPHFKTEAFYPDVLGDTVVANLMGNLIDNKQKEAIGLAFDGVLATHGGTREQKPQLGFEFRFRKGPDSLGYYTGAFGGEDYTVINIYLDVTPIQLTKPLYRPLAKDPS